MNILIFPIRSSQKSVIFEPTRNERSDLGASLVHVFRRRHYYWATAATAELTLQSYTVCSDVNSAVRRLTPIKTTTITPFEKFPIF